jgi:hypothetical protein
MRSWPSSAAATAPAQMARMPLSARQRCGWSPTAARSEIGWVLGSPSGMSRPKAGRRNDGNRRNGSVGHNPPLWPESPRHEALRSPCERRRASRATEPGRYGARGGLYVGSGRKKVGSPRQAGRPRETEGYRRCLRPRYTCRAVPYWLHLTCEASRLSASQSGACSPRRPCPLAACA